MKRFQIVQSARDFYTSHSGLALIGLAINRHTKLKKTLRSVPKRHGIANVDLIRTFVGQLCLGKSDFDAIENVRFDRYFKQALGIKQSPSAARLRQRFDEDARALIPLIDEASIDFVSNTRAPVTPLPMGHVALDLDVFPMDNSRTKKEGVSYTYKGHDGYAPMAAYLGQEGWCLACELREGSWHSQKEFLQVLERVVPRARKLTDKALLARLDSAHDAQENRAWLNDRDVDFIIKWNPRGADRQAWVDQADHWEHPREGKRVAVFNTRIKETFQGQERSFVRVIRVIERTIDKHGQGLLLPAITLEGWWTTLTEQDDQAIIDLYCDHATSEQFHSEFKTDLDIERLPSGKFDTNDLVLAQAVLAYNILRWIGLMGLTGEHSPVRHRAKRRRLRTVMQELMYLAARLVTSGRRLKLKFSQHCPGFAAFNQVYQQLAYG